MLSADAKRALQSTMPLLNTLRIRRSKSMMLKGQAPKPCLTIFLASVRSSIRLHPAPDAVEMQGERCRMLYPILQRALKVVSVDLSYSPEPRPNGLTGMRIASFRRHEGCRLPHRHLLPLHLALVLVREDPRLGDQSLQS